MWLIERSDAGMTIDLTTSNENDDIQRAVEESLKNQQGILGGQVTREDEEISKCVPVCLIAFHQSFLYTGI